MPERAAITGVILAGGAGRRVGGADKGLLPLAGRPMVAWVIDALRPQVGALLLGVNRSRDAYDTFGLPLVGDAHDGFAGPLAGVHAALAAAGTDFVLTAPCDTPRLPADLVVRLGHALDAGGADIAVAVAGGRLHPVHALMRRTLAGDAHAALRDGACRLDAWQARHRVVQVPFDDAGAFTNINTLAERDALAAGMAI